MAQTRFKLSGSRIFFLIWDNGIMRCAMKKDDIWRWNFGATMLCSKVMAKKPKSAKIWWIVSKKLKIALNQEQIEVGKNQIQIWISHFDPYKIGSANFLKKIEVLGKIRHFLWYLGHIFKRNLYSVPVLQFQWNFYGRYIGKYI